MRHIARFRKRLRLTAQLVGPDVECVLSGTSAWAPAEANTFAANYAANIDLQALIGAIVSCNFSNYEHTGDTNNC